jgi:PAS domain-containing protein
VLFFEREFTFGEGTKAVRWRFRKSLRGLRKGKVVNQEAQTHKSISSPLNYLEDFFENAAVGLHIVDHQGNIVRANKAELAMLGYRAEEYIGRHISAFHLDPEVIADVLSRLGRGEEIIRYPARLLTCSPICPHS